MDCRCFKKCRRASVPFLYKLSDFFKSILNRTTRDWYIVRLVWNLSRMRRIERSRVDYGTVTASPIWPRRLRDANTYCLNLVSTDLDLTLERFRFLGDRISHFSNSTSSSRMMKWYFSLSSFKFNQLIDKVRKWFFWIEKFPLFRFSKLIALAAFNVFRKVLGGLGFTKLPCWTARYRYLRFSFTSCRLIFQSVSRYRSTTSESFSILSMLL